MELFRHSRDVYGQTILEGVSWDLFYITVGVAVVFIAGHLIFKTVLGKKT
ncbi:MAG: hypothetical protein ACJZ9F_04095 [Rhodospirillaceae bacterium]